MRKSIRNRGRAGFSVLELMISVTLLSLLVGALSISLSQMRSLTSTSESQATLQDSAERAMKRIVADLSRSGALALAGDTYPHLFDDGAATGSFAIHAHAPAVHQAVAGDADFGPSREIVFVLPRESDPPGTYGNDVPDIDANANLIWDTVEYSYVLVTGADGVNRLQRRSDAGAPVDIASNLERVVFDDNASSGFAIPIDSVRIRLFFRRFDAKGVLHRYRAEQIVKLRNGI